MQVLLATNYFKGSLSAVQAADIIEKVFLQNDKEIVVHKLPMSDGGDGTLDALKSLIDYEEKTSPVNDPLGRKINAKWLVTEFNGIKTAIIESAQACGLSLLKREEYNPMITNSFGVGELILEAVRENCKQIILTLGGSSTNDGGAGLLQALGVEFLDKDKKPLPPGGGALEKLFFIDNSKLNPILKDVKIIIACDVKNPLCGNNGASKVYALQKGATEEQTSFLDINLLHFADIVTKTTGKDFRNNEGSGAAGGMAFGVQSFLNAEIIGGFDFIAEISGLNSKIKNYDYIVTTEGRLDNQTLQGKTPYKIAKTAFLKGISVIFIVGSVAENFHEKIEGLEKIFSLTNSETSENEAFLNAEFCLAKTSKEVLRFINKAKI